MEAFVLGLVAAAALALMVSSRILLTADDYRSRRRGLIVNAVFLSIVLLPVVGLLSPLVGLAVGWVSLTILKRRRNGEAESG